MAEPSAAPATSSPPTGASQGRSRPGGIIPRPAAPSWWDLPPLASYLVVVLSITWPVAGAMGQRIVGHELAGAWRTMWAHWWTGHRLQTTGQWPLTTWEIAFPREGPFSSIAPVNDALSLPLQAAFGLVAAYNLVVFFHMSLALTGGYVLARSAGVSRAGSWVAGLIFGLNGFLLSYGVASAVVETSTVGWLAWFLAAMLWLVRSPGPRSALATGATFAMAGLSSIYWTVIIVVCLPPLAIGAILGRRSFGLPLVDKRLLAWIGGAIAVAVVVFGPPAWVLMSTYLDQGSVLQDYAERKQQLLDANVLANLGHDFATLQAYLLPGKGGLTTHEDMDLLAQTTYAGWVALLLAAAGVGRGRWRWVLTALVGLVLSLGPFAFLTPTSYSREAVWWWVALREAFPPVRMITSYVRFSCFFFLGLAVLGGFGVDALASRALRLVRGRGKALVGALVGLCAGLGVLGELRWVSPVPVPLPWAEAELPPVSLALAELPTEGAVLDWPQRYPGKKVEVSRYFFYQSAHGRPIPYDFAPTSYMPGPIEGNPFFARLERVTYGDDYQSRGWTELTDLPARRGLQDLVDMGFVYLALHPEFVDPDRLELVVGWLDSQLERVELEDPELMIYVIELTDPFAVDGG